MPNLPTLPDRAWYAYHCLARDGSGAPPPVRELERVHGISGGTISRLCRGERVELTTSVMLKVAVALEASLAWLQEGGPDEPEPPVHAIPPRPGTQWIRHSSLPGWEEAKRGAIAFDGMRRLPPEAYQAAGEMTVFRPIERLTPEVVLAVAAYAWETSSFAERARFTTADAKGQSARAQLPRRRAAK